MYLSLCISLSFSVFSSELICGEVFSLLLFPIKSPVASAVAIFEAVLSASVADYLA